MANRIQLEKDIKEYCELNQINDVPGFITQCMLRGFNIFKFGLSPGDNIKKERGEIVDKVSNRETPEKNKISHNEIKKEVKPTIENKEEEKTEQVIVKKKRKIKIINNI